MADDMIYIKGKRAKKGERMTKGTGWRLAKITGKKNSAFFVGTLLQTINIGNNRIAIFSVPVRNIDADSDPVVFDPKKDRICGKCGGSGCKALQRFRLGIDGLNQTDPLPGGRWRRHDAGADERTGFYLRCSGASPAEISENRPPEHRG